MISPARTSQEGSCLVLIDYDNAFPPSRERSDDEIAVQVASWLQELAARYAQVSAFEVRLYGGWYDDKDLSLDPPMNLGWAVLA